MDPPTISSAEERYDTHQIHFHILSGYSPNDLHVYYSMLN